MKYFWGWCGGIWNMCYKLCGLHCLNNTMKGCLLVLEGAKILCHNMSLSRLFLKVQFFDRSKQKRRALISLWTCKHFLPNARTALFMLTWFLSSACTQHCCCAPFCHSWLRLASESFSLCRYMVKVLRNTHSPSVLDCGVQKLQCDNDP